MKKPSLAIIIANKLSKKPPSNKMPEEDVMESDHTEHEDGLISCCEDILAAIKADDATALAEAFQSASECCESDEAE